MTVWDRVNQHRRARQRGSETVAGEAKLGTDRPKATAKSDIAAAAGWLRKNRERLQRAGKHPVPELQREFLLSSKECCQAIRLAHEADSKAGAT